MKEQQHKRERERERDEEEREREKKKKEKGIWRFRLILGRLAREDKKEPPSDGLLVQVYCLQQAQFNTTLHIKHSELSHCHSCT